MHLEQVTAAIRDFRAEAKALAPSAGQTSVRFTIDYCVDYVALNPDESGEWSIASDATDEQLRDLAWRVHEEMIEQVGGA